MKSYFQNRNNSLLPTILHIETGTSVCSVGISKGDTILALAENNEGQSHARLLNSMIVSCLNQTGLELSDLDAVSVSKGPGSYTGLRIGTATAKGLCYALGIPLIGTNTLLSMASKMKTQHTFPPNQLFIPMIDARRLEVYTAVYDFDLTEKHATMALVLNPASFLELIEKQPVIFFGDGMPKFREMAKNHTNIRFIEDFGPSATGMIPFSQNSYKNGNFEDLAYFEPFYLKDFYTPGQPQGRK